MKKVLSFLIFVLLLSSSPSLLAQKSKIIINDTAGKLASKLSSLDKLSDLTIQGPINSFDLQAIGNKLPDLLRLNLKEATFKAFVDPYDPYSSTSDNCFTSGLSYKTKKLQELILPSSITKIASYALGGLSNLTKLTCPTTLVPSIEGWGTEITDASTLSRCTLYVLPHLIDNFKSSKAWNFSSILSLSNESESPFEANISLVVNKEEVAFLIKVKKEGNSVSVRYPDGKEETQKATEESLTLSFKHLLDRNKISGENDILISAPQAILFSTQNTGVTMFSLLQEPPLQELSLRYEADLSTLDLSKLSSLENLNLSQCKKLTTLTLPKEAKQLKKLLLPGTSIQQIELTPYPSLEEIDLAGLGLSSLSLSGLNQLQSLDLSDNKLKDIDLTGLSTLSTLRLGFNLLSEVTLPAKEFDELNVEHNQLSAIDLSQISRIGALYCNDNCFTLDKLPSKGSVIKSYIYAPQAKQKLPLSLEQGATIDLSPIASLKGILKKETPSTFKWYDHKGNLLTEGTDYEVKGAGLFVFLRAFPNSVYCKVASKAFPKFTKNKSYETTPITITAKKQANFTYYTSSPTQNFSVKTRPNGSVSVRTADGKTLTAVGDSEYGIARFAHHIEREKVDNPKRMKMEILCEDIYSFAAQGTNIVDIELNNCPLLKRLTLKYQNLSKIDLSNAPNLEELYLDGNSLLAQVDLSNLSKLRWLNVGNLPKLTSLDLTHLPSLTHLIAYNTQCSNLSIEQCPNLEELDLTNTHTSQLEVGNLVGLKKLLLADNQLETLEISELTNLIEVNVAKNKLTELQLNSPYLETLNVAENNLHKLTLHHSSNITSLYCNDNCLSLDQLPSLAIDGPAFVYAPQAPMKWDKVYYSTKEEIDLSHLTQLRGILGYPVASSFSCFEAKSNLQLQEGKEYKRLREGVFQFTKPSSEEIYFIISTSAYPAFQGEKSYKTEPITIVKDTNIDVASSSTTPQISRTPTGIVLTAKETIEYTLYTLSGSLYHRGILTHSSQELSLPSGSYLLVYKQGGVKKSIKLLIPTI